jgi:DHA2 family lincomycin resistance protein-like MFS transporter
MSTATLEVGAEHAARNRLVINLLLVSSFVVILNETMMAVATPALMQSLGVTAAAAQWLTTAFLLTMAVGIPMTGFLLQRLHTRTVFILAMSLFSIGTSAATLAPGLALLIVARVIQASGTAIMMPLLMTSIMTLVEPASRGKTMGFVSAVISVAPAIGPVLSGVILNYLHWRWMFVLVLPFALFSLWLGWRRIENVTTPREAPLDIASVILSAFAFGGSVYGISLLGAPPGADNPPAWIPLVIGGVAMVVFVWRQLVLQRKDGALLDLRVFHSRMFTISLIVFALLMLTLFGTIILLPIYLQNVLGLSTLQTGLLLLPGALLMGRLGPTVGRAYDRIGASTYWAATSSCAWASRCSLRRSSRCACRRCRRSSTRTAAPCWAHCSRSAGQPASRSSSPSCPRKVPSWRQAVLARSRRSPAAFVQRFSSAPSARYSPSSARSSCASPRHRRTRHIDTTSIIRESIAV